MQDAAEVTTEKLYDRDAYRTDFTARAVRTEGSGVVLDRTLFFPEEGGQSPDRGVLGGFQVTDVQIRGGEIIHTVDASPEETAASFPAGAEVEGRIDWANRFSNMQQHSGEHLISGLVHRELGFDNVGFHLSAREVTLDFSGVIEPEEMERIEELANEAVTKNIETKIFFTTKEERADLDYRSKLDLEGTVRIVEFPGYDRCACCAPHVRRTGEIGLIKVTDLEHYKGGVRVRILCGSRAMALFRTEHAIVTGTARYLTTSPDQIGAQVRKMKEELRKTHADLLEMSRAALARAVEDADPGAADVLLFFPDTDPRAAREAVTDLAKRHAGYAGIFTGTDETGYQFVIASDGADAREAASVLRREFGARGGGRSALVQGSVQAAAAAIRAALSARGTV